MLICIGDYVRVERFMLVIEVMVVLYCGSFELFKWKVNEELVMFIVCIDVEDCWLDVVIYNNMLWYIGVLENLDVDVFE